MNTRRSVLLSTLLAPFARFLPSSHPVETAAWPEHWFWMMWYENKEGEKWRVPLELGTGDCHKGRPEGYDYAMSCFPTQLDEVCHRTRPDGGYGCKDEVYRGSRGWSTELVNAMVRGGVSVEIAIIVAAKSCERCMNVTAHKYGLDWGYPMDSEDYKTCNTSCDACES